MPVYEPVLLPHLESLGHEGARLAVSSPIEEELALPPSPGLWERLAGAVRRSSGLPLLTVRPEGARPVIPAGGSSCVAPRRILLLETPAVSWLVLEHPSALPLFDQLQRDGQQPALARPSLFLEWHSQALGPGEEGGGNSRAETVNEDPASALHAFLSQLNTKGPVSDWHLEPLVDGYRSRVRTDGRLLEHSRMRTERGEWLLNSVIGAAGLGNLAANAPADGAFSFPDSRGQTINARVSLVPSLRGLSMVLRFLHPVDRKGLELEKLGFQPHQAELVRDLFAQPDGLWLVAGPTGSWKSTTLYSLLCLAASRHEKILTAEDPVEMILPGLQQVQVDDSAGTTFATLLRAFMRQAPDAILIGEIRDEETAAITLQAANSGHRVLGSIHASGNQGVLRRFHDLGQSTGIVKASCAAVVHQRLVSLVCANCAGAQPLPGTWRRALAGLLEDIPAQIAAARGCPGCSGGYAGRTGIYDLYTSLENDSGPGGLLRAGWPLVVARKTTPDCLLPYFPPAVRRKFTLCHV